MNNKTAIIDKVLKHYMGVYDLATGNFKNKTRPMIKKIENSSSTVDELIESLLNSSILKYNVAFTSTGEKWNPVVEPLIVFLSDRTHWKFWEEGFNEYLTRTEGNNTELCSVLFERKDELSQAERDDIRQWLLEE